MKLELNQKDINACEEKINTRGGIKALQEEFKALREDIKAL